MKKRRSTANVNLLDRALAVVSPTLALNRVKARTLFNLRLGGYEGADRSRRSLRSWLPGGKDADGDLLADLPTLRENSRDLIRNNPLAGGPISSVVTNVVGQGLKLQARPDRDLLGLDDAAADAWERQTEREFRLWSTSTNADICRQLDFTAIQNLVFRQTLENGDIFILRRHKKRPQMPYTLSLQLIEADRISNPDYALDQPRLAGGVEKDADGAAIYYHINQIHPGNRLGIASEWAKAPVYGDKSGIKTALHIFDQRRPGQSRGVPYLAAVIEPLKQLSRYTEAEITAAVISGMFTVFVKSDVPDGGLAPMFAEGETAGTTTEADYKLGSGAIIDLAENESIETANPGRPNAAFDPFVLAILRQIGVGLELPYEFLIKHYTSSYTAARAAILDAWRFFLVRREWLVKSLCRPVYEMWMAEAVALGRINAPGFFTDPLSRQAWLGSEWIGPARGQVDDWKEVNAAEKRINIGLSTIAKETAQLTGADWETNHGQRVKEVTRRRADGLEDDPETTNAATNGAAQ